MRQVIIVQADQYVIHFHYVVFEMSGIIYPFALNFFYLYKLYQYICIHIYLFKQIFDFSVHQ